MIFCITKGKYVDELNSDVQAGMCEFISMKVCAYIQYGICLFPGITVSLRVCISFVHLCLLVLYDLELYGFSTH